jgi:hypothetical protein
MSEWWTYSLSDFLLFSPRIYYRLFELYNAAIWPLQILALALGAAIFGLLLGGVAWRGRAIAAILAACWLWVAWAYFLQRYDTINWAASYFAAGFAAEAMLISWTGIIRDRLVFRSGRDAAGKAGRCILLFALVVFPLIGPLVGRPWTQVEVFGVTPDPTSAYWPRRIGRIGRFWSFRWPGARSAARRCGPCNRRTRWSCPWRLRSLS